MKNLLEQLLAGHTLDADRAERLLHELTEPSLDPAVCGAVLAAMRVRGETADEIRGFAHGMRALARRPELPDVGPTVDVVGTGGDGSGSINISTGVALLAAAVGQKVVKHGNRSISSRSGSADVLEQLGLAMPMDAAATARCLETSGFTFLFAPHYHPAMKVIAPVRQALGVRTIFNILGPLTNPAEPDYHLLGAFSLEVAELMAHALSGLPIRRGFVVHGEPGWDEATSAGPFELFDVSSGKVTRARRDPADYDLPRCRAEDLLGGDAGHNAALLRATFAGRPGAARDTLVLGAALVLELVGEASDPVDAARRAAAAIDDGRATRVLERMA